MKYLCSVFFLFVLPFALKFLPLVNLPVVAGVLAICGMVPGFCHETMSSCCISMGNSLNTFGSTLCGKSDAGGADVDAILDEHDATGRQSSSLRFEKQSGDTIFFVNSDTGVDVCG